MDFQSLSFWLLVAIFVACAAAVWACGTKLSVYVDAIAGKTALNRGFLGALLLGGITSIPEMATVSSSAAAGNAALAMNNLFGTVANNFLFLVLADFMIGKDALTSIDAKPSTLLQGVLGILLLVIAGMACLAPAPSLGHVSSWSLGILASFVFFMWLASQYHTRSPWVTKSGKKACQLPAAA